MTSKLKCPFCKEEIISDVCCIFDKENKDYTNGTQIYKCNKCGLFGNKELVQKLIRTCKALDVAVDTLGAISQITKQIDVRVDANIATETITALEQKKSEFAHNKIEFPEFNDNLLEEFDKQFFENGQDDDLTETAPEQKGVK